MESRERVIDVAGGLAFLLVAAWLAVVIDSGRTADALLIIGLTVGYALASNVRFEYASFATTCEQVVFVAMLVLLPLEFVPALVAAARGLGTLPEIIRGTRHRQRFITEIGGAWFVIGPVAVVAALAPGPGSFAAADVYALAFVAYAMCEIGWAVIRDRVLMGHSLEEVLQTSAETLRIDAILSPLGFVVGVAAVQEPLALLSIVPLVWLLQLFSQDRAAKYSATLELSRAYRGTVMLLGDIIEYDDKGTGQHSRSVVDLVRAVGDQLGVDERSSQELDFAALLHDVGKIVIPKEILNKPAALTDAEFEVMKTHTIEGQFLLDRIGGMLGRVGEIVRSCHERWDGRGYPDGLAGEEIPLSSRIVFACDAYHAMTSDRPYRDAMSREEALLELHDNAGTQFDPDVVAAVATVVLSIEPSVPVQAEIRAVLSASAPDSASPARQLAT